MHREMEKIVQQKTMKKTKEKKKRPRIEEIMRTKTTKLENKDD